MSVYSDIANSNDEEEERILRSYAKRQAAAEDEEPLELNCKDCEYYDPENENCSYLSCDGLDCEDAPCGFRLLADYYEYELADDDLYDEGTVIVNGKPYVYEMTLSMKVPDEKCCRVFVEGNYYYFG